MKHYKERKKREDFLSLVLVNIRSLFREEMRNTTAFLIFFLS